MEYKTIRNEAVGEFEEKKSVFIGSAKRVSSEEEAKDFINYIRSKYRDARHNVYAYVIGQNFGIQRYSDDGEPQGTGGIPVLEVIKRNGITDTVIVVTRYFGGILLGASGLTRAYSKAAAAAVKNAGVVEKVAGCEFDIKISYDLLGKLQYLFSQNKWQILGTDYSDHVILHVISEERKLDALRNAVVDATLNKCEFINLKTGTYFLENDMLLDI